MLSSENYSERRLTPISARRITSGLLHISSKDPSRTLKSSPTTTRRLFDCKHYTLGSALSSASFLLLRAFCRRRSKRLATINSLFDRFFAKAHPRNSPPTARRLLPYCLCPKDMVTVILPLPSAALSSAGVTLSICPRRVRGHEFVP